MGIDLGTSSVKVISRSYDGPAAKAKQRYDEPSPAGWQRAVKKALAGLDLSNVAAIGLSSQVGTYIIDGREVIGWDDRKGVKELEEIKKHYGRQLFMEEISMPHPNIISYPLPRLRYIAKHDPGAEKVCQPKDFLCEMLTGNCVTDPYSWRGLANLSTGRYSRKLLDGIGFSAQKLPRIIGVSESAGCTKEIPLDGKYGTVGNTSAARSTKEIAKGITKEIPLEGKRLPAGIPVFTGLNDFFASLLGMGVYMEGELFDITGTSEHIGVIEPAVNQDTALVSGPYLSGNAHYGVTASSGASLDFCQRMFGLLEVGQEQVLKNNPPVFLPYLNGERAPIWDPDARGMFFGIHGSCQKADMAYSVLEGVVFSLYHIYESMGMPKAGRMLVSGGAAANHTLNELKAEMFGVPVLVPEETDTSALGAWMAAAVGMGWFADFGAAIRKVCKIKEIIEPCGRYQELLKERFAGYKTLYPAVKKANAFRRPAPERM